MSDRVTLVVCAAVAVIVHVVILAWPAWLWWSTDAAGVSTTRPQVDHVLPERDPSLGRPASQTASVAWISHDDFRKLVAPRATTEQPALQRDVDPVADAPLELEPTPPAPAAPPADASAPQAEATAQLDEPPLQMQREADPPPLPELDAPGRLPRPRPQNDQPIDEAPQPDRLPSVTATSEQASDVAAESPDARPTAAPRDEAEADPTQLDSDDFEEQPGGVLAGPGLKVQTVRPNVSIMTRYTASPRDLKVKLHFNRDGEVASAELVGSTGYRDWDGAILTSLYRWRAKGERLDAADPHIIIEIDYRFVRGR